MLFSASTSVLVCSDDGEVINKLTSTIEKLAEATTAVAIEGKRAALQEVLTNNELKRSLLLCVSFVKIKDSGCGCLTVASEENEKIRKHAEAVKIGMAEVAKQREEVQKMKADLEKRERLMRDSSEVEDEVVELRPISRRRPPVVHYDSDGEAIEPRDISRRKRRVVVDDLDGDAEDSDGPLLFAPVRSRRRIITPSTPSPPPRMCLDLIAQLFVMLSISGNEQQMLKYDFVVNGKKFWALSGFHRQQGVAGKLGVDETEDGGLVVRGIADCGTLVLPHHVFVAAEAGDEFVDLCPGQQYHDAEPNSFSEDPPRAVRSILSSIGISCATYTRVRMGIMVLAYIGLHDGQRKRKGGRHLVIGYVWFQYDSPL